MLEHSTNSGPEQIWEVLREGVFAPIAIYLKEG